MVWTVPPERDEAGTPNVIGAVALARACRVLDEIGMERVAKRDESLRDYAVSALRQIPGLRFYGLDAPDEYRHVAVLSFDTDRMSHGLLAAVLGHEWGIGVRHGCFCAHPYIMRLLKIPPALVKAFIAQAEARDHGDFPGLVRLSLGMYNTRAELDYAAQAIRRVLDEGARARYFLDRRTGNYVPLDGAGRVEEGFQP